MESAEFRFDFGENAVLIYRALVPEVEATFPRSRAELSVAEGELHLTVAAEGIAALRAALNTWLRLIKVACEMSHATGGKV
ncbi:MAG TPA: hypothetical protein ENF24_03330 [Methanosarcinales archaeon]|nr:hypothetical protein [Methanosarcinales archaeon]